MQGVTRKLLLVEAQNDEWMWAIAHLPKGCRVHELPSGDELGRVARAADPGPMLYSQKERELAIGQAIQDALTKRRE